MDTKNYDVTVVNAIGNGKYFEFIFKFKDGSELTKTLQVISNGNCPHQSTTYSNLPDTNREETILFRFQLPEGYKTVCQLWEETQFKGLKGELTIQTD